ncbi:hypothetical protein OAT10_00175 [Luminiphilus sp.]|nr:hypothetical protein [Luminiphilus sp.]
MNNKNVKTDYKMAGWAIGEETFHWIHNNIEYGSTILEFGSGDGSDALSDYYKVHCIEHDMEWVNKFEKINYYHAEIIDGWYNPTVLDKVPNNYSLIIIDGPPGRIGRSGIKSHLDKLNLNVPIIIDDTHRLAERELAKFLIDYTKKDFLEIKDTASKESVILL